MSRFELASIARAIDRALAGGLCACIASAASAQEPPGEPAVHYVLSYAAAERDTAWHVRVEARDLAGGEGPLLLHISDWGEWTRFDSYHLRHLVSDPPARPSHGTGCDWTVDPPADWDGELVLEYEIATTALGSSAMEQCGLCPYRAPTYTFGFTTNTLVGIDREGWEKSPRRSFRLEAPDGWTIASGLGGLAAEVLEGPFPDDYDNGVISMGLPVAVAEDTSGTVPILVVQWGGEPGVVPPLLDFARRFVAQCTETSGVPPRQPIRLLVTEPGFGGTRTDGSIAIGCPELGGGPMSPWTLHFVAHEIFHDWLGGQLDGPGEHMAWFWEGFTDYLALWHLARAGLVSREWFAERLLDYEEEIADNEHRGRLAYADPEVNWRDPAIEPLAYKGSALLAFALDAELRAAGETGLMTMIRDLLALPGGRYDLDALRHWASEHDQRAFWERYVASTEIVDPRAALRSAGYEVELAETPLTYLGLQQDGEGPFGPITAVDPDGPGAAAGVLVGDVVTGCSPVRGEAAVIDASVDTPYRFGLGLYEPDADSCHLGVRRGDEKLDLTIVPRRIAGGRLEAIVPIVDALDRFFR